MAGIRLRKAISPFLTSAAYALCIFASALFPFCAFSEETLAWNFESTLEDRVFIDIPLKDCSSGAASALSLAMSCDGLCESARAVTLHLRCGSGWWVTQLSPGDVVPSMRLPLSSFQCDGATRDIAKADLMRLSVWRSGASGTGSIAVNSATLTGAAPVRIIRTAAKLAPGEEGAAATYAALSARIFAKLGIEYDFIDGSLDAASLKGAVLVALPYAPKLSGRDAKTLCDFIDAGGKVIAHYQSNERLATRMGMIAGPWEGGGRSFHAIRPLRGGTASTTIPHITDNIIAVRPRGANASVAAMWIDDNGRESDRNAIVLSRYGAWFAHTPPLAYPAAVELFHSIVTNLVPTIEPKTIPSMHPVALPDSAQKKTIAVWMDSTTPCHKRGWRGLGEDLYAHGVNTIFIRTQAGTKSLLSAPVLNQIIDDLHKSGLKVHIWATLLNTAGTRQPPDDVGRHIKPLNASPQWIDPQDATNRKILASVYGKLALSGADGIHLDYVRSPDGAPESSSIAADISKLVSDVCESIRKAKPGIIVSAAVYPTPQEAKSRNQIWNEWITKDLLDFVCPMIYEESPSAFAAKLAQCIAAAPTDKIIPGFGIGADGCQLSPDALAAELVSAEQCMGMAFYSCNAALLDILEKQR